MAAVTKSQMNILRFLEGQGDVPMGEIVDFCQCSRANVTIHIIHLVDAGMVQRRENPDNRREKIVALTKAGTNYMKKQ